MIKQAFSRIYHRMRATLPGGDERRARLVLREVYAHRADLQESFPEAARGDYERLVRWAAGVAEKRWLDAAYPTLQQFANSYSVQAKFLPKPHFNPSAAFKAWNRPEESLPAIERRIHDGVPTDMLRSRGDRLIGTLASHFPGAMPDRGRIILEIGSGVGYLMEAASKKFDPSRIIGLDIAPAMIQKAKERLARDKVKIHADFLSYDGITIPIEDKSVDYIYSVACLQHIPRPYVYNLFGEMLRVLKPGAYATLHFLSFAALTVPGKKMDLRLEIAQQLAGAEGHWHHFYTREELLQVLRNGYGAYDVSVIESEGALWAAFTNQTHESLPTSSNTSRKTVR